MLGSEVQSSQDYCLTINPESWGRDFQVPGSGTGKRQGDFPLACYPTMRSPRWPLGNMEYLVTNISRVTVMLAHPLRLVSLLELIKTECDAG